VRTVRDLPAAGFRIFLEFEVRRIACQACGSVKRERLDFLADNPRFTKRFAFYVGRRCRQAAIRDVACELRLTWHTAKTLEMQYMKARIARAGTPAPRAIGINEISVRRGHTYRIVVSDLVRKLLSRRENLTLEGKRSLALLLAANKRLNTAYVGRASPPTASRRTRCPWALSRD